MTRQWMVLPAFASLFFSLSVLAAAPILQVQTPLNNSTILKGQRLALNALAEDPEEGDISHQIQWTSSLDGALYTGEASEVDISAGEHVITATVFDSEGYSDELSVRVIAKGLTPFFSTVPGVTILKAISENGLYAGGCLFNGQACGQAAHVFTPVQSVTALGIDGRTPSEVLSIANNGTSVGYSYNASGSYVATVDSRELPHLTATPSGSRAYSITPDGKTIVGKDEGSYRRYKAVKWTQSESASAGWVIESLGDLPTSYISTEAHDVSDDGAVIVGFTGNTPHLVGRNYAFIWTPDKGIRLLGSLPGGSDMSEANAVSADGQYIAGIADSAEGVQLFRWSAKGGMEALGLMPENYEDYRVGSISDNGKKIVIEDLQWDEGIGLRSISEVFSSIYGIESGAGITYKVNAMSGDGRNYVGSNSNNENFNLRIEDDENIFNLEWELELPEIFRMLPSADTDGNIYIAGLNTLYAIYRGHVLWQLDTGESNMFAAPAVSDNGMLYFATRDKKLWAVNKLGNLEWVFTSNHLLYSQPALANNGNIYIASVDGLVQAVTPDGKEAWRYQLPASIYSSIAIAPTGELYVHASNGKLYAFTESGHLLWSVNVIGSNYMSSPVTSLSGMIYLAKGTKITALNPNGIISWTYDLVDGGWFQKEASIDKNGQLFIGISNGYLKKSKTLVLDALGQFVKEIPSLASVHMAPVLSANGETFILDGSGIVNSYNAKFERGKKYWVGESASLLLTVNGGLISSNGQGVIRGFSQEGWKAESVGWSMGAATPARTRNVNYILGENQPAIIEIQQPLNGSEHSVDDGALSLLATAIDLGQGDISQDISWSSSLDGQIHSPVNLSVGKHTLTAQVVDAEGLTSVTSVDVVITAHINVGPNLNILQPGDNSVFSIDDGALTLEAIAQDEEEGDISGQIIWSSSIDGNIQSPADLSVGQHVLTAQVSDQQGLQSIKNVNVTITAHVNIEPLLLILQPGTGNAISVDAGPINFMASASDMENGDLTNQVKWHSNLDGNFQSPAILSVGQHLITATVTDLDNASVQTTINLTVTPHINIAPTIVLDNPAEGDTYYIENGAVQLSASADDAEEGALSSKIEWYSSLQGNLGTGAALSADLQLGEHIITATITDVDNASTSQSVTIHVQQYEADISIQLVEVDSYNYLMRLHNNGPNTASDIIATLNLPSGVTVESFDNGYGCVLANSTLRCSVASLSSGDQVDIAVRVSVASKTKEYNVTANVTAGTKDTNSSNNTVSQTFGSLSAGMLFLLLLLPFLRVRLNQASK